MAMAGTAPEQEHSRKRRRGRRRGSLTPELIVKESLRLLDENGLDGFSLPKLGRALGADPTAVYRHFASKDDLVLAIADQLIEDAMAGLTPQACWIDTMTEVVRRLRRTYCEHPAAAWLSACRTTRRPAEMRVVDVLIGAVLEAGFEGAAAARVYRAIGDFAVYWSWVRAYRAVDRADHPHIWRLREELPEVTDDAIFETTLSLVVGGLTQIAPHPCGCGRHEPQPAETDGS